MHKDVSSGGVSLAPALEKWDKWMQHGIGRVIAHHPNKFRKEVANGIPSKHRWEVWRAVSKNTSRRKDCRYEEFLVEGDDSHWWLRIIDVDAPRTFPELPVFNKHYEESLRRVLKAYANLNPKVRYCQGMNFIAGVILIVSKQSEEDSFWMFVWLMEDCGLCGFYMEGFPLLRRYLNAAELFIRETIPELDEHLHCLGGAQTFVSPWFLSMFISFLPMNAALVVWDTIICNGLHMLLTSCIVLLEASQNILFSKDAQDIMTFFRTVKVPEDRPKAKHDDDASDDAELGLHLMKNCCRRQLPPHIMDQLLSDEC